MMPEVRFEQDFYPSADGRDSVACYLWLPEAEPIAVVQLSHGMQEYAQRYEPLARFLCEKGFAVGANDHLGHGNTARGEDGLGFTAEGGGADAMIADLHTMTLRLRERFPGLPLILVGHSMGSFIARNAAADFPGEYSGTVFVGTGGPEMPAGLAKLVAAGEMKLRGERHRSTLLTRLAFGSYNRRYPDAANAYAWVSRDTALVERYMNDKFCHYCFTSRGFYDLFELLSRVSRRDWAAKLPPEVPVLLLSGDMDPVGNYGRGVSKVYDRLKQAGIRDLTLKLYPGARHEVFNETNRDEVFGDLYAWLLAHFLVIGGSTHK